MGYHIAMTLCSLILPLTMVGVGAAYTFLPAENISRIFGYRTPRSMASPAAWLFANRFFARLWLPCGIAMTPITLLLMILLPDGSAASVDAVVVPVMLGQVAVLVVTAIATEIALHIKFDPKGNPKP